MQIRHGLHGFSDEKVFYTLINRFNPYNPCLKYKINRSFSAYFHGQLPRIL